MPLDPFLQQSQESVLPAQAALMPGQKVFGGRFILQRHLGQGGMGQVWLAQDTTLEQPRALKFLLPALLSDAQARKRLRNEARLGTELEHPRIVRVFHFIEETGSSPLAAVVMEFVEGRTLNELLAEKQPGFFEPEEIQRWVLDVIEGLRYAHEEKQRFHLDLKPGNIIVEAATGRARLLDFGISRSANDSLTRITGQIGSGTLPYMSPQQLDGEPPGSADDVYGLGATVYELLTGTPPFFRGKLDDQIRSKAPDSLAQRRKMNAREGLNAGTGRELSSSWEKWMAASLSKNASARVLAPAQPQASLMNCLVYWWSIVAAYASMAVIQALSTDPSEVLTSRSFFVHTAALVLCMIAVGAHRMSFRCLTAIAIFGHLVVCTVMFVNGVGEAGDVVIVAFANICICALFFLAGRCCHRNMTRLNLASSKLAASRPSIFT
ncbi:MAG: serine/threonine-protein kinase [Prosthecobacter sp.]